MKFLTPDKEFKKIALNIGTCMLIFLALFTVLFYGFYFAIVDSLPDTMIGEVMSEIIYGLFYLSAFIVPALIFRLISKKTRVRPLDLFHPISKSTPMYIFFTIAIGFACSYITSLIFSSIGITDIIISDPSTEEPMQFYQFLLGVFTMAVVPAVCEEFLFRSTILSNLLPYGQGFAIVTSSLLFGLMHQNIMQIFYTTMAGIILGYTYVKTRSYLCVFLIHFCNNFISVVQEFVTTNFDEIPAATIMIFIETVIFTLGILSAFLLTKKEKVQRDIYAGGAYGKLLEPSANFNERKISFDTTKKFFLSPTVLIFTILAVISMITPIIAYFIGDYFQILP